MSHLLSLLIPVLIICASFGQTTAYSIPDFTDSLETTTPIPKEGDYAKTGSGISHELPTTHPITPVENPPQHAQCGYRTIGSKTENETNSGEFPWYASLMTAKEAAHENYFCNAVIIGPTVVLTSAICAEGATEEFFVQAGDWQAMEKSNERRVRRVEKVITHESYEAPWLGYDIALLIVESPFEWEDYVHPVCLPEPSTKFNESRCYYINWNKDDIGLTGSQAISQRIDAPIVPLDQCLVKQRQYAATFKLQYTDVCAGGIEEKNYNIFDSGSPLVCPEPGVEDRFFLVGILSRYPKKLDASGRSYIPRRVPKVFVSVPVLLQWLKDTLTENGIEIANFSDSSHTTTPTSTHNEDSIGNYTEKGSDISVELTTPHPTTPVTRKDSDISVEITTPHPTTPLARKDSDISVEITTQHSTTPATSTALPEQSGYRHVGCVGTKTTGSTENGTDFGEFPWFATLLSAKKAAPENFLCSGVIIAPKVVLTSAACAETTTEGCFVQAGEWKGLEGKTIQHRSRRVDKVIRHEGYNEDSFMHNIALLIVERPFEWEEKVRPVSLPESNTRFDEARCYFTNWMKDVPGRWGSQAILQRDNAPIMPLEQCYAIYRQHVRKGFQLEYTELCAGGKEADDYDIFDGGSPLVCPVPGAKDRYFLAGISSHSPQSIDVNGSCYLPAKVPRAYAKVPLYLQWLNEQLTQHGIDIANTNSLHATTHTGNEACIGDQTDNISDNLVETVTTRPATTVKNPTQQLDIRYPVTPVKDPTQQLDIRSLPVASPTQRVASPNGHERCGYPTVGVVASQTSSTEFGEFPWFATLMTAKEATTENYFCCGVIIAPTVVVTNADCAASAPEEFFVQAGEWLRMEPENIQHRARRVVKVITHEHYDEDLLTNNIALLIVESPFQWEQHVRPVCLPANNTEIDEARCYFINWTGDEPGRSGSQAILKRVTAPIVPLDQCMAKFQEYEPNNSKNEHIQLCAGADEERSYDIFSNGSPLVCPLPGAEDRYFLAGVVSHFPQREDPERGGYKPPMVPRAYIKVPLQSQWLNDQLTQSGIDLSYLK